MTDHPSPTARWLRLLGLLVLAAGFTFGAVYWIGTRAAFRPGPQSPARLNPSPGQPLATLPGYAYAALDPAVIPALAGAALYALPGGLRLNPAGLPPIGVYLPSTGDTQFALRPPTPTPALAPLGTPTPLASPPSTANLGIITPGPGTPVVPGYAPTILPQAYGGDGCAPAGWPAPGLLTQYFTRYHRAIDIGVPLGTPVVATHSGEVIFAGWRTDGYGNLVIIQNGAFITYYAHLNDFNVVQGQQVGRLSVIGWSGSTGNSTGPHIHYEIRIDTVEVDPLTFEKRGHMVC